MHGNRKPGLVHHFFYLSEVKVEEMKCRNDWSDA